MNGEALFLAEIVAFDPALGTTRTLRFANRAFRTKPSETPANTPYEIGLEQPSDIGRSLFGAARTRGRSTMALGDLTLVNPDGEFDYLNELAFDTRTVTIRRTTKLNPSYPADFDSTVLTMEQPLPDNQRITFKLRDRFYEVANTPLQTNKYLGNNALPNGLEGTTELKGKPKPVCFGVVRSVPAPPVNTSKLIYQPNDGALHSVDNVYDRGVPLIPGRTWTSIGVVNAQTIRALTYANGIFVSMWFGNKIYTSPDGVAWTLKQTLGSLPIGAAFNGTTWVVVTATGDTVTSTNNFGSITTHAGAVAAIGPVDLCYHATAALFVCAGAGGIETSPDGVTWTLRYNAAAGINLNAVTYGNGVAVAVGGATSVNGIIVSSSDGIGWNDGARNLLNSGGTFTGVTFGDDRFVSIGPQASAVSFDGFAWQVVQQPLFSLGYSLGALAYSGLFVVLPLTGSLVRTSIDGLEWHDSPTAFGSVVPARITANSAFVMVAIGGTGGAAGTTFYTQLANYSSTADLLDDTRAPMPGEFIPYLAGGCVRLGSSPDGQPLFDVTEGATAADRTAAQIVNRILARVAGAPSFDAGDIAALDILAPAEIGDWINNDGQTCDAELDFVAGTPGAAWYPDKLSAFRIARFEEPSGTPDLVITQNDIKRDSLKRVTSNDEGNGIPIYQVVVQWGRFYQTITSDIAGGVTDASRADFAQEWRNAVATDLSVLIAHPSAGVLTIQSAYANEADALAEANRQLALRSVKRDPYELTIELNDETSDLDLNSVVEIVHPRYSLSVIASLSGAIEGGGLFRVLDARPNAEAKELTLTVWGGARYKNVIDHNGAYVLDKNGAFVIARIAA